MEDKVLRIILLGPPGSGKGTQATQLCARYGLGHVSTGDILRRNTQKGTDLGVHAQQCMQAGGLVPDELIFGMLEDLYLRRDADHQSFVLDGFPRSRKQALALSEFLQERGQAINKVLLLEIDDDVLVGRLIHRRSCPKCGRSYHLSASPPQRDGICDADGVELMWRSDDREEVIRKRLITYHSQTKPVAEFYADKGVLATIDASGAIDEIRDHISTIMEGLAPTLSR